MVRGAKHKQNLMTTAMRLFRRQGYASTGLNQVLAESGAPKGSLYHYFPGGKEELALSAVQLAGDMVREMLVDLAEKHEKPKAFVRAYCETMASWMEESGFRSGCPIATTMLETAPHSPALTNAGNQVIDSWIEVIASVLIKSGESSRIARRRAQELIGAIEGGLILARIRESTSPLNDVARSWQ